MVLILLAETWDRCHLQDGKLGGSRRDPNQEQSFDHSNDNTKGKNNQERPILSSFFAIMTKRYNTSKSTPSHNHNLAATPSFLTNLSSFAVLFPYFSSR